MLVFNDKVSKRDYAAHGLPDEMFSRGKAPMTKQEVRSIVLSKLRLKPSDTVFDIGAGTGSVAVEMALLLTDGAVYALEKDGEAVGLLQKNKQLFSAYNLHIRQTVAPDGLAELPVPDKVFIGGSGGKLQAILDAIYSKNPEVRVVISVITLETLSETVAYYKNRPDLDVEIVSVAVAKAQKLGDYNLLKGQNPVFIITAESKDRLKPIEPENLRESGEQA
jgi:precorrin-6Y C5,15-methyltransferase (decarboxylating)